MTKPAGAQVGLWWRFDRYEIRSYDERPGETRTPGGSRAYYVGPAAGATLEAYDPWDRDRAHDPGSTTASPYDQFLNVAPKLSHVRSRRGGLVLSPEGREAVLGWCRQYGLLGVLPHRAQAIALAPRWQPVPVTRGGPGDDWHDVIMPAQRWYLKTGTGWVSSDRETDDRAFWGRDVRAGAVVDGRTIPEDLVRPHVVLVGASPWEYSVAVTAARIAGAEVIRTSRLDSFMRLYFPTIPEEELSTYPYPEPLSVPFWRLYAEPLDEVIMFAHDFRSLVERALEVTSRSQRGDASGDETPAGLAPLHNLLSRVSPMLGLAPDGTVRLSWFSHSLMGTLAMMVAQDLVGARRLRSCERCGTLFMSTAYQAQYCSPTCRSTIQKRRQRSRKKEPSD